jgi:hypothetical protein
MVRNPRTSPVRRGISTRSSEHAVGFDQKGAAERKEKVGTEHQKGKFIDNKRGFIRL